MARETSAARNDEYRPSVGIMLLNDQWQVLVARRIAPPLEAWQMPQGGIDDGETPLQAAFRELKEEIGVDAAEVIAQSEEWLRYDLPTGVLQEGSKAGWRGQRQKWFIMRFTGNDCDIDLNTTSEPEFDAWRWIPVKQLPDMIVSFKRQVYLDLLSEFPHLSEQSLVELLEDPIVRVMMAADGVDDKRLSALLQRAARELRRRAGQLDQP
jgi:putative (di)nucleoside polyphosphate hydrolase